MNKKVLAGILTLIVIIISVGIYLVIKYDPTLAVPIVAGLIITFVIVIIYLLMYWLVSL